MVSKSSISFSNSDNFENGYMDLRIFQHQPNSLNEDKSLNRIEDKSLNSLIAQKGKGREDGVIAFRSHISKIERPTK